MKNKAILFSLVLVASGSVFAEQNLLGNVAEQAAKNTATAIAPDAVKNVGAANQAVESAKSVKENVVNKAPDALQNQVKETVKEKANAAVPEQAKKAGETLKSGKKSAEKIKGTVDSVPKSTKALENKTKEAATDKALNLLH